MILLNDERILNVTCTDNKEKMITLRNVHKNLLIDESRSQIGSKSDFFCYARESVVKKLMGAADYLPCGYKIVVKEAYRPLSLQRGFFEEAIQYYKNQHPLKNEKK